MIYISISNSLLALVSSFGRFTRRCLDVWSDSHASPSPLLMVLATVFLRERPMLQEWLGIAVALAGGAVLSYETTGGRGSAQGNSDEASSSRNHWSR
jgi:hypothetical protein